MNPEDLEHTVDDHELHLTQAVKDIVALKAEVAALKAELSKSKAELRAVIDDHKSMIARVMEITIDMQAVEIKGDINESYHQLVQLRRKYDPTFTGPPYTRLKQR